MMDITYTIGRKFVVFTPVTPKGAQKCQEMQAYAAATGHFLRSQLPAIVANLEGQGFTIAAAGSVGAEDATARSNLKQL